MRAGPLTTSGIVAAVEAETPGVFGGREGLVFPLLLDLRRRGLVRSAWVDADAGRRNLHGLADADFDAHPPAPTTPLPGAASPVLLEAADEATARLRFAPRLREEFRIDVLHHLEDASAARQSSGATKDDADAAAVRALGDPWKISVDLERTAQGKRTVIFPSGVGDHFAGIAIYDLRVLLVILAVIVFVRVQVITAYHIPTKSMEPTLHGDPRHGDRILVNQLSGPPKRFDITVFDGFGADRKKFVKRCTGLPGETLSLHEGDLWVDGHLIRKDGVAYEALLFEVFDSARERGRARTSTTNPADAEVAFKKRIQALWKVEGPGESEVRDETSTPFAGFLLTAPVGEGAPRTPQLAWPDGVADGYVDSETGNLHAGGISVSDVRLTVSVDRVAGTDAEVSLRLTRGEGHTYDAVLGRDGKGVTFLVDDKEVARSDDVGIGDGAPTTVSFSQVDYVLRFCVEGRLVLRHDLPEPESPQRDGDPCAPLVRVTHGAAWIAPVRLERDVYYVPEGPNDRTFVLGPDQYFMMGDNSSNSQDSRMNGPVHKSRLVGTPLLVVWPPSRIHIPK